VKTLEQLASCKTLRLTTVGRKSGLERTAEVWFVVESRSVLVQAGPQGSKGWYANLRSNPQVTLLVDGMSFSGKAECIEAGVDEEERVAALFRRKYWLARMARWLGSAIGRGRPVRIHITEG